MTQTASFKDKIKQAVSFFRWELRSCSGTVTVYSILMAVFMTISLTLCLVIGALVQSEANTDFLPDAIKAFQYISAYLIYGMTIIFTVIYTMKVFSYLHDKRKADLYGSMPVSRITLYLSKIFSALAFSLVPSIIFMGIMSLISICFGQTVISEAAEMFLNMIIGTIASVSGYGLIAICCGTTLNSVIMFIAVCIAYPLSAYFVKGVFSSFLYGTYSFSVGSSFILYLLSPLTAYDGQNKIYWIVFTVLCIAASAFLVKKRKAERAQSSFAYYLPCHIVKILVSFLVGMFLGTLFGSFNVFGSGYPGFVFGFLLGSAASYVIAHLIFYKGFSKLIKTSVYYGVLAVVVIALMAVLSFDLFGFNSNVPSADEIESAGVLDSELVYYSSQSDLNKLVDDSAEDFSGSENIENIVKANKYYIEVLNEQDYNNYGYVWVNILEDAAGYDSSWCSFSYKLKNGDSFKRVYRKYNESCLYTLENMYSRTLYYDEQSAGYKYSPFYYDITDEATEDTVTYDDGVDNSDESMTDYSEFEEYTNKSDTSVANYFTALRNIVCTKTFTEKYSCLFNSELINISDISVYSSAGDDSGLVWSSFSADYNKNLTEDFIEAYKKDFESDDSYKLTLSQLIGYDGDDGKTYNYGIDGIASKYPETAVAFQITCSSIVVDDDNLEDISSLVSSHNNISVFVIPKSYTNTLNVLIEAGIINDDFTLNTDYEYYCSYY